MTLHHFGYGMHLHSKTDIRFVGAIIFHCIPVRDSRERLVIFNAEHILEKVLDKSFKSDKDIFPFDK